jgi:hypothetical protein
MYEELDLPPPADGVYRVHYSYDVKAKPPIMGTGLAAMGDICVMLVVDDYKCWYATRTTWIRVGNKTHATHPHFHRLQLVLTSEGPQWRSDEEIVAHVRLDGCLVGFTQFLQVRSPIHTNKLISLTIQTGLSFASHRFDLTFNSPIS